MKHLLEYFNLLVIEGPREFWKDAVQYIRTKMDLYKIRREIKLARKKTQVDKKHRYIVRALDGRPMALTTNQIKRLKRTGKISKSTNCVSIYENSLEIVQFKPGFSHRKGTGKKVKE